MMFISLSDVVPLVWQNWIVIPSDTCGLVFNLHSYVYNIKLSMTSCYFFTQIFIGGYAGGYDDCSDYRGGG